MMLIGFSCSVHKEPVPYDRVIRSIDEAYEHCDKEKMEAVYGGYLDELFDLIKTCKERALLKDK